MLLALGAATVGVLTWTLLTHTPTASAHTPEGVDKAHDTPAAGKVDLDGSCAGVTVGTNQQCDEDSDEVSKGQWYHQNYWHPYRCDRVEKTVSRPPGENGPTTETVVEWENCRVDWTGKNLKRHGLQFFTDHPDPLPKSGEASYPNDPGSYWNLSPAARAAQRLEGGDEEEYGRYLRRLGPAFATLDGDVPPDGGQPANGYRSWCGAVEKESDAEDTGGADCQKQGHRGNNDHKWWNHGAVQGPPLVETVVTHTIYDLHDHCDDANTVHRNDDGECPTEPPVCELEPLTPVLREEDADENDAVTTVRWTADASGVPCTITQQQLRVTLPDGTSTTRPVSFNPLVTSASVRDATEGVTPVKVEVRVRNEARDPSATPPVDGWSDWGEITLTWTSPDDECARPDAPVLTRDTADSYDGGYTTVEWTRDETEACPITGQQLRITRPRHTVRTPTIDADDKSYERVPAPTLRSTPVTVEVRVGNHKQGEAERWSGWGVLELPYAASPAVCPLPAAPTVTKHGFRTRGGVEQQRVEWEIRNPPAGPCEVTGWLIYYGTDAARPLGAGVDHSWERKPGPGSRIRVFVRAENPVRPGSTAKQLGNSGWVDLLGDTACPVPAAPVLTGSGTGSSRLVTWTVADSSGVGCEITGQELRRVPQRGISSTRDRDKNTRESTQSVTDRTGDVVVSVRAKNRVQPGGTDQQCGGSGDTTLSPPDDEEKPSRCATATVDS